MEILFTPPVLFIFFLGLFALVMLYLKRYAAKGKETKNSLDAYACGQKNYAQYVNPDYKQFFRYAFVFSIMHVVALIVTTAPKEALWLPLVYIAVSVLTLAIIFRK